eukprot:4539487-Prorocentrum_lima.AAC.1
MTSSLVGSEMCIRDRFRPTPRGEVPPLTPERKKPGGDAEDATLWRRPCGCLLYTSDAADDM